MEKRPRGQVLVSLYVRGSRTAVAGDDYHYGIDCRILTVCHFHVDSSELLAQSIIILRSTSCMNRQSIMCYNNSQTGLEIQLANITCR